MCERNDDRLAHRFAHQSSCVNGNNDRYDDRFANRSSYRSSCVNAVLAASPSRNLIATILAIYSYTFWIETIKVSPHNFCRASAPTAMLTCEIYIAIMSVCPICRSRSGRPIISKRLNILSSAYGSPSFWFPTWSSHMGALSAVGLRF